MDPFARGHQPGQTRMLGVGSAVLHAASAAGPAAATGTGGMYAASAGPASSGAAAAFAAELAGCTPPQDCPHKVPNPSLDAIHDAPRSSPADVGSLSLAASASRPSTQPPSPGASLGAGSRSAASSRRESSPARSWGGSFRGSTPPLSPCSNVDIPYICMRLKQSPLTGQVVAWAWGEAAALSHLRRAPPVSLMSALWPATQACAALFTPEDVLDMLEAWLVLLQQWPRHFHLPPPTLSTLTHTALPAAVKRMPEARLARLGALCRDIALHRTDIDMQCRPGWERTHSARDLMQPIFALVAAEVAWQVSDPARHVDRGLLGVLEEAAGAWRWTAVPFRDPPALVALKEATSDALRMLRTATRTTPHSC